MPSIAIIPSTKGFHWEEVFDAYKELKAANWQVVFHTVDGSKPIPDPLSIQNKPFLSMFGLGTNSSMSPESPLGQELQMHLAQSQPITHCDTQNLDAIYIPGGHGCLFDVNINAIVHQKILEMYLAHKLIAAVCHGSSCLAFVNQNGGSIINDKRITGFPDALDKFIINIGMIDKSFLPLPYLNEAKMKDAGASINFIHTLSAITLPNYYVVDLPFITGVGPKSVSNVIKKLIQLTEKS